MIVSDIQFTIITKVYHISIAQTPSNLVLAKEYAMPWFVPQGHAVLNSHHRIHSHYSIYEWDDFQIFIFDHVYWRFPFLFCSFYYNFLIFFIILFLISKNMHWVLPIIHTYKNFIENIATKCVVGVFISIYIYYALFSYLSCIHGLGFSLPSRLGSCLRLN